jgi:hypothetical protein
MKSRRFENTVEATRGYCLLRIPQLWAVRFMRPAARTDTISEIKIDTLYMSYRKESIDIDIKSVLFQEKICGQHQPRYSVMTAPEIKLIGY